MTCKVALKLNNTFKVFAEGERLVFKHHSEYNGDHDVMLTSKLDENGIPESGVELSMASRVVVTLVKVADVGMAISNVVPGSKEQSVVVTLVLDESNIVHSVSFPDKQAFNLLKRGNKIWKIKDGHRFNSRFNIIPMDKPVKDMLESYSLTGDLIG